MTVTISGTSGITTPGLSNTGNETVTGTLTTNGITAATGGITFNANPGSRTQATLNDYETGTYTPTVTNNAGSISYSATGAYAKVGVNVTVVINVAISSVSTNGNVSITLPFAPGSLGAMCYGRENAVTGASLNGVASGNVASATIFTYSNGATAVNGYNLVLSLGYVSAV